MVRARLFHTLLTKFYTMPLTKVTSTLINTVSASQITATGATAGQVLTYNGSTSTWEASAAGGANPAQLAKAYVNFDGTKNTSGVADSTATARYIRKSYNVVSVVRQTQNGSFVVNFTPGTFSTTPYVILTSGSDYDTYTSSTWLQGAVLDSSAAFGIDANSCRFEFWGASNASSWPANATLVVFA